MASLTYEKVLGGGPGWTRVQLPDGRAVTIRGDRAMRNNNPGNIEFKSWQRAFGALGDDGRFAVFRTREDGVRAHAHLLFEKYNKKLSLAEAIRAYAPKKENNTRRYQSRVQAISGVPLDTRLADMTDAQRVAVVRAMHEVEGNTAARVYDDAGRELWMLDKLSRPDIPMMFQNFLGAWHYAQGIGKQLAAGAAVGSIAENAASLARTQRAADLQVNPWGGDDPQNKTGQNVIGRSKINSAYFGGVLDDIAKLSGGIGRISPSAIAADSLVGQWGTSQSFARPLDGGLLGLALPPRADWLRAPGFEFGPLPPDPIDTRSIRGYRAATAPYSRAGVMPDEPATPSAFVGLREPSAQLGAATTPTFSPPRDLGRLLGQPAWDGAGLLDMAAPDPSATGLYGLQPAAPSAAADAMLDGLSPAERMAAVASGRVPRFNLDYRMAAIAADPNLDYAALESNPTYMAPQTLAGGATLGQIGPDGLAGKPQYGGGLAALWDPEGYAAEQQRMAEFERKVNALSAAAPVGLPDRPMPTGPVRPGYAPFNVSRAIRQDRLSTARPDIALAAASRFAPELEPVETNVRTTPKQGRLAAAPVPARFGRPAPDDVRYDYQTDLARLAAAAAPVPARFGRPVSEEVSYDDPTKLAGPAPAPARFGRPAPEDLRYDYQTDLARLAAGLSPPQTVAAPDLAAPREIAAGPTIAAPRPAQPLEQATARPRRDQFPPAPQQPSLLGNLVGPRMGAALLGASIAGLPGAIVGGLLGEFLGGGVGGLLGDGGPVGPASPGERFNAGYGTGGIERGMYGPRGATGHSLSNPGSYVTSRGPGQGYDLTSGKYGWREHYDANGNFRGISYADGSGGLLGGLSRAFGGLFGGDGGKSGKGSKADKDKDGLGVGLF